MNPPAFSLEDFLKRTNEYFEIKKTDRNSIINDMATGEPGTFGFYSSITAYTLKIKSLAVAKELMPDHSDDYCGLDVAMLHAILIEKVLGIAPDKIEEHVRYERGSEETMRKVDSGEFAVALLMNSTKPDQVKRVAENRERMPQKSTDFFPKLVSGLVFYDIAQ